MANPPDMNVVKLVVFQGKFGFQKLLFFFQRDLWSLGLHNIWVRDFRIDLKELFHCSLPLRSHPVSLTANSAGKK